MGSQKPVHTIVLDAGPIIKNDPSVSSLLQKADRLITVPSVLSEIKDPSARSRVQALLLPFLIIRAPSAEGLKIVTDFARKTGDLAVLSRPDIQVIALAYDIECERNGGDWRLRRTIGQKGMNALPPQKSDGAVPDLQEIAFNQRTEGEPLLGGQSDLTAAESSSTTDGQGKISDGARPPIQSYSQAVQTSSVLEAMNKLQITPSILPNTIIPNSKDPEAQSQSEALQNPSDSGSSDSDGWITPSNIKKHQARDMESATASFPEKSIIECATITTDFAMQNVLLQMNLNLLSPALQRVQKVKSWILRCHACFDTTKDMSKQFCTRCGNPTLTRVSCSVSQGGKFTIYLKKNMQWSHRGDRFSIPKLVPGAANGKVGSGKGGGKGGWGQELILSEDQKEYMRAMSGQNRRKEKDLMDEDYLPGILSGERKWAGGRPKIGGGRNVNSKKR